MHQRDLGFDSVLRNEHRDKSLALLDLPLGLSNEQELRAILPKIPEKEILLIGMVRCITHPNQMGKALSIFRFCLPITPSYTVKAELVVRMIDQISPEYLQTKN